MRRAFGPGWASLALPAGLALAFVASAQTSKPVARLELIAQSGEARVRPLESIVLQVRAHALFPAYPFRGDTVSLRRGPALMHVRGPAGGWLSKPFRLQGLAAEPLPGQRGQGFEDRLSHMADRHSGLQDAVLFTAPADEGEVVVTATLDGVSASLTVLVDNDAPSTVPADRVRFGAEPLGQDPYRALAEHYAPFVAQATWFQPRSDYIVRFDMDGDWRGDNNWANAPTGSTQAYVYYAAMESETHWFLVYNFFHPRDYSDKCASSACHENDSEGLVLTVAKDGSPMGRVIAMETLAHNKVYSYRASANVGRGFHGVDGDLEFFRGSHPVVFVQAGGHGVYGTGPQSGYSFAEDRFLQGTGVTYIYKGFGERPKHPADRLVGYDLLSIYDHWWLPAHASEGRRTEAFGSYYRYEPFGERPVARYDSIAGAFRGRRHGVDKAKPFWAWHDNESREKGLVATGQWALDPAYSVSRNLNLPEPFSLRYVFNPYLMPESVEPVREP